MPQGYIRCNLQDIVFKLGDKPIADRDFGSTLSLASIYSTRNFLYPTVHLKVTAFCAVVPSIFMHCVVLFQ
jgi:hypothetical protein